MNCQTNNFTRDNHARENMKTLIYRPNEFIQILLDYAISSFMLNQMEANITDQELTMYCNDKDSVLDYSGTKSVQVVAIATAINTYWAYNLIAMNRKLKNELILNFITERYIQNKRQ